MKSIAFYLPQFHPIPENDLWWGEGFTEWHNVTRAKTLFKGHRQPQIPGKLGFYDLRCEETQLEQIALAKEFCIDAFCYYHYWFGNQQLLETPLKKMLNNPQADFPFCVCWANETWSRTWDGKEKEILIAQTYEEKHFEAHADYLCSLFKDARYLKINGEPIFVIYRLANIPKPEIFLDILRKKANDAGFSNIRIFAVRNFADNSLDSKFMSLGIKDIIDFAPNPNDFPKRSVVGKGIRFLQRLYNSFAKKIHLPEVYSVLRLPYNQTAEAALEKTKSFSSNDAVPEPNDAAPKHHPTIFPNWDNSPRRRAATIIQNDSPENFENWTAAAAKFVRSRNENDQFLFINAWNEWAESAHLEPERKFGLAFLEAFRQGLKQ